MSGSWKKTWSVAAPAAAVAEVVRLLPQVYGDGLAAGIVGRMGRTYAHQRKDFKPRLPRLTADKGSRLVFQHDLITPCTYVVDLLEDLDATRVQLEVRTSGSARDTSAAEQVVALLFALSKAVEPAAGADAS